MKNDKVGRKNLSIRGVSVSLPTALFNKSEGRVINGKDGAISNSHWAIFPGPDLVAIHKVVLTICKVAQLPFDEPWEISLHDVKRHASNIDIKTHLRRMYDNKKYALADDVFVLRGEGDIGMLVSHLSVTQVDDDRYRLDRGETNTAFTTTVDPRYYFAFRHLGFSFLIGPDEMRKIMVTDKKGNVIAKKTPFPQMTLLVRANQQREFEVCGCLMGRIE